MYAHALEPWGGVGWVQGHDSRTRFGRCSPCSGQLEHQLRSKWTGLDDKLEFLLREFAKSRHINKNRRPACLLQESGESMVENWHD